MIVPDASVRLLLFIPDDARSGCADRVLSRDPAWVVPERRRTEVLSGIRGLAPGGKLSLADAGRAVGWLGHATLVTADARIQKAHVAGCRVQVIA